MKHCVLIIDGAAGWPVKNKNNRTTLEIARTPHLDRLTAAGRLGLAGTVPQGMEPSSAIACMSLLGYDPRIYYRGRAAIEAVSMGVPISAGEVVFRANLVAVKAGSMWSYCAGQISGEEASQLIADLNQRLGSDEVSFHTGVGYRHLLKIKGHSETARALCTPPHDISGKPVRGYLPRGRGSRYLRRLMADSERILGDHPVNLNRIARGQIPATMAWLFWGSGRIPSVPSFEQVYGLKAALTSGVDLLRGLGQMMGMTVLDIAGVTDNLNNDFAAQAEGGLAALRTHDLVVIHVEAPDEAGHAGSVEEKVTAIERIDEIVISRLTAYATEPLKMLIMPDHPTPVAARTHVNEPVPFLFSGAGFNSNGARRFSEKEAAGTGLLIQNGFDIMRLFTGGDSLVQA